MNQITRIIVCKSKFLLHFKQCLCQANVKNFLQRLGPPLWHHDVDVFDYAEVFDIICNHSAHRVCLFTGTFVDVLCLSSAVRESLRLPNFSVHVVLQCSISMLLGGMVQAWVGQKLVNITFYAMGAHERPLFEKLLWGLVSSTIFVRC